MAAISKDAHLTTLVHQGSGTSTLAAATGPLDAI
jgi:hypothetical protein